MFYLDSSVAVSAVSAENGTEAVLDWLADREGVLISDWLITEAIAALSQKLRMQVLSPTEHARSLAAFHRQIGQSFALLPVTRADFRLATHFAERPESCLRGGDALHLAIASSADATLVTLDRRQARAGELLRIDTLLLDTDK